MTEPRLRGAVLVAWAVAAAVLALVSVRATTHLWFPDPDDAMRLLEVRDWLGGQSWWDVGQHRLNHGDFPMHWSRLVDLPLAAVLLVADPLFGSAAAIRIALVGVPLATLLAVMALGAELTRRTSDLATAKLSLLLAPLSVPLLYQLRPLRIDHHGWQIVLALAAVVLLVGKASARTGALIGLALATLLTVSLEGLPITVAILGVALLGWAFDPARRAQVLALLGTIVAAAVLLHAATRGPGMFAAACDALAPAWIAALAAGAVCAGAAVALSPRSFVLRVALLGAAGVAALVTIRLAAPECLAGPFATLDPEVYRFWYRNVSEGLPVWEQEPGWALLTISFPFAGFVGGVLAWRELAGAARIRWTIVLALALAAFVLSLLVMRSGATANALALPGGAWLLNRLLTPARRIGPVLPRTFATAGAFLAASPGLAVSAAISLHAALVAPIPVHTTGPRPRAVRMCYHGREIADLGRLPSALVFAPIDVSPTLIAWTSHRAIAGGYHRNSAAMKQVIDAFTADPATARAIVTASGATLLAACPGENEMELYKYAAPNGLWARLERGERFGWLQPVPLPGSPAMVWRIVAEPRTSPSKALSEPASKP
ncbi:hypothetical protein [uncultured Sphingomonas sp.]|uniref:hypothetical protein n=1 Tax=uncultured Sphingomonas sp. TaxID=158754 RepID=UPI0035CC77B8